MTDATKWLFFDLGWTLIDETNAHRARCQLTVELLEGHGVHCAVDELWQLLERAATDFAASPFFATITSRLGLPEALVQAIRRDIAYDHGRERLYPGVEALLGRLSKSHRLGVIANQSTGTEERLRRLGIRDAFSVVAASAELGIAKPDPRIFQQAARTAGCSPADATMIGDRLENDIAPAKRLGWSTVRVLQGFARHQVARGPDEVPDLTLISIIELEHALERRPE